MIIDVNAWTGQWGTFPIPGKVWQVRQSLKQIGVDRMWMSPLGAAWSLNPHLCNDEVYQAGQESDDIDPVPIIDPTIPSWPDELDKAKETKMVHWVKLLPAYGSYTLCEAKGLFEALSSNGMGVIVQVRLEDPRRQHPLAQVPDVPARDVVNIATQYPDLRVILSGAGWPALLEVADSLSQLPNLYADTSQIDGLGMLKFLVDFGLETNLLFGSHTPLFIPLAGLARVLGEVDDQTAETILGANASRLLAEI
jgi:hypothetical protein